MSLRAKKKKKKRQDTGTELCLLKQQGDMNKNKQVQLILPQMFYTRSKQLDGKEDKMQKLKADMENELLIKHENTFFHLIFTLAFLNNNNYEVD